MRQANGSGNDNNVVGLDSLVLTEVSLCDDDVPTTGDLCADILQGWAAANLQRVEIPLPLAASSCLDGLQRADVPIVVRCSASAEEIEPLSDHGIRGVTIWVSSAVSLARRPAGVSRPPSALKLQQAVDCAPSGGLEITVAFPLETDRLRTHLNFGYLAQSFGVDRLRLVDQAANLHPLDLFRTLRALRERLCTPLEMDINNTWGVAVGAALCAIRAGVRHLAVSNSGCPGLRHVPLPLLRGATRSVLKRREL